MESPDPAALSACLANSCLPESSPGQWRAPLRCAAEAGLYEGVEGKRRNDMNSSSRSCHAQYVCDPNKIHASAARNSAAESASR